MKLHPAWRVPAYLLLCLAFTELLAWFFAALGIHEPFLPPLMGITVATWFAVVFFDRGRLGDLGLEPRARIVPDLAIGFCLPPVLLAAILAAEWGAGWLLVAGVEPVGAPVVIQSIWRFGMVAWYEELMARGYLLQTIGRFISPWLANPLSALIFAGLHLANPGASFQAFLGIFLAGLLLGFCFQVTRSLYLPMAFHASWNLSQALLGFPVSGVSLPGLLRLVRDGPILYTGGTFGPEAGLLGFFVILVAMGTVRLYAAAYRHPVAAVQK